MTQTQKKPQDRYVRVTERALLETLWSSQKSNEIDFFNVSETERSNDTICDDDHSRDDDIDQ